MLGALINSDYEPTQISYRRELFLNLQKYPKSLDFRNSELNHNLINWSLFIMMRIITDPGIK